MGSGKVYLHLLFTLPLTFDTCLTFYEIRMGEGGRRHRIKMSLDKFFALLLTSDKYHKLAFEVEGGVGWQDVPGHALHSTNDYR